jgi:excisionase family DNA binding protein
METILCSISDALVIAGVSRSFLYERLGDGSIRAVKAGRKTLVDVSSLTEWAASLPSATFKPSTAVRKEVR